MLDTISDLIGGLVEFVSRGVYAVMRGLFRWEASEARPAWIRVVAIGLIIAFCVILGAVFFAFLITAFYVLLAIAVVGAIIAFFFGS